MSFVASTLLLVLALELALAGRCRLKHKTTRWGFHYPYVFDRETGYRPTAHFRQHASRPPKNAKSTGITCYDTGAYGFRWYNVGAPCGRVLFLGDSFTEATDQENVGTFIGRLARRFPKWELINAGIGGARSIHLQHVLECYLPRLQPSAVVVQLPHNDFYDAALGLTRIDDRFTHRLSHAIPCSRLENVLSRTHLGSLLGSVLFKRKKINLTPEEKFHVLTENLDNTAWSNLLESCCRRMATFKTIPSILFYIPPHPFARNPDAAVLPQALPEIGIASPAWYELFVRYYDKLDAVKERLVASGIPVSDPNLLLETHTFRQRLDFFVDRSHLSSLGHSWFADILGDALEDLVKCHSLSQGH